MQTKSRFNEDNDIYVTKLFVYFTLNDISEVTLFCKSWFVALY